MDDYECDFDELDKLISQEVTKESPTDYENEERMDTRSVLEGAYSKIAFYSETTWWDQEEVDEYRVNNLGLWSAVMGCDQCKWNQNIPVNEKLTEADENSPESKKKLEIEEIDDDSGNWLKTTPWPASLLKLYPQIPDAVASKNVSIFSHFHSTFAGDLLYSKIGNVKELIQYNRLKQDCVKNLWNGNPPFEDLLNLNLEEPPEPKVKVQTEEITSKEESNVDDKLTTITEICDSFNAIISQKTLPVIKGEIKNEKLEVKIKLLERKKTFYDFQKEFESAFNSLPASLVSSKDDFQSQGNQCKKLKTEKIENSYTRKSFNNKNKNSQTELSKKNYKLSEKSSSLIKENFGSFPINQGEIIETLEEVCQWLHNVYPHKTKDEGVSVVTEQSSSWTEKVPRETSQPCTEIVPVRKKNGTNNQIKKILPRPTNVSDFSSQIYSQIPSRRLYRDVLTNSEVQSCMDADPVNKFAELEREAMEQYSGCSINSENSIALLHIDEDSKFTDLEREAIEQYQPEEDSILTSGELFTPSELLKQSPIGTPPKVNSSTQVNIFETQQEIKKEKNCLSCQALRKSSSEYLLCSDTWPEGIDNIFTDEDIIKFENSKISSQSEASMNKKYLKNEIDTPIRILKHLKNKESTPIVDNYESVSTSKTLTYTSPYDSPTEELQSEECTSKIVKFILKKNQEELSEEENNESSDKEKPLDKTIFANKEEKQADDKNQESCSKAKESDEEKSGQDDSKKKKKKKKRSRKKKGCKKDGGGGGGGGGGGNGRGGGGRCDARTPIHCPIPLSTKTSESKIKKKDDSNRKDKKGDVASNSMPYKWHRLYSILTKLSKTTDTAQKRSTVDDLFYNDYYVEQLSMDKIINLSSPHNFLKRIPSYLFTSKNEKRISVLVDLMYYRLQRWGWCYVSYKDLFSKCLHSCCFTESDPFPSWLKWCKCFSMRIGQSHAICPSSKFVPDTWRIPRADVYNPKYWELSGGGMLQGIVVSLGKNLSVQSFIYSVMNSICRTHIMHRHECVEHNFSINQYKYIYEVCCQKIYHVCSSNDPTSINSEVLQKKTNARHKFHRGKNNKIKGKTFCYYCSGNSFKNYTLHTFFCEVDAQNKGIFIDREKIIAQPVKKAWTNTSTSSKYQQTEKDFLTEQEDDSGNDISSNSFSMDESNRCLNKGCYKCRANFNPESDVLNNIKDIDTNQIHIRTPVVSAKDVRSIDLNYNFESDALLSSRIRLLDSNGESFSKSEEIKKITSDNREQGVFLSSFDLSKIDEESSKHSLNYLFEHQSPSEYCNDLANMSFEGFNYIQYKEMKVIKESQILDGNGKNEQQRNTHKNESHLFSNTSSNQLKNESKATNNQFSGLHNDTEEY